MHHRAIVWSPEADATIIRIRALGASWDAVGAVVGVCRWTTIERGRHIGARFVAPSVEVAVIPERDPLPPGHPDTWGAIIAGTSLAGTAYPHPVFV